MLDRNKYGMCIMLCILLLLTGGCRILESLTNNINGWDLSACVDGFSTCWELFTDNADKFEGSFVEAMENLP